MTPFIDKNILVIVAHPDDETLFASSALSSCRQLSIVHVTDGATSRRAAVKKGFRNRSAYAKARHAEFLDALQSGRISAKSESLGYRDQRSTYYMGSIAKRLENIIRIFKPELVLTHAYEGCHLDHDTTCFAAHLAIRRAGSPCPIWEFAAYHVQAEHSIQGLFPENGGPEPVIVHLNGCQKATKREMLHCFVSQAEIIAGFTQETECFRPAPQYNFKDPPFSGRLGHEAGSHGREGRFWRALATAEHEAEVDNPKSFLKLLLLRFLLRAGIKLRRFRQRHFVSTTEAVTQRVR